jgi:hypothetical protein
MVIGYDTDRPDLGMAVPRADIDAFLSVHGLALTRGSTSAGAAPNPRDLLLKISALVQCVSPHAHQTAPVHGRNPPLP